MNCKVLDTGPATADENMRQDAMLLRDLADGSLPILHLYDWLGNSLTYGYFVDPLAHLIAAGLEKWEIHCARRPTGGGIIFHTNDLAFSLLLPASHPSFSHSTLANYAYINGIVLRVIERFKAAHPNPMLLVTPTLPCDSAVQHFCMAHPTHYDVMLDGRKVGGAAQRRTRHGLLHQGSICLGLVDEECLAEVLLPGTHVAAGMRAVSYPLMGPYPTNEALREGRQQLRQLLVECFGELL